MKVAICDDIPIVSNYTERLLLQYDSTLDVEVFNDSLNLERKTISGKAVFDVYLLDIDIPELDGISLAKSIRKNYPQAIIIFLTSYKEYMSEVFCLHTFDYLIKPLNKENVFRVMENVVKYQGNSNKIFQFVWNKSKYAVLSSNIIFFEKSGRKVKLHGKDKEYEFYMSTAELLRMLSEKFIQIHGSYVINSDFITSVHGNSVDLKYGDEGIELPFGRKFKSQAKEKILYMFRESI